MDERWVIEFNYPEQTNRLWAGMHEGALGWAPQIETAIVWVDKEAAERTLTNGYGNSAKYGRVVPAPK
jgi:hypothetical protein